MNSATIITAKQLPDFLLNIAIVRPVFIWGPPGIGKSSLVQEFARMVGIPCVSLLGSQLAPEDLIGVPQIVDDKSRFTDGFCDRVRLQREHAFLLPEGHSLPFVPKGRVFRIPTTP